jgi:hypothetical protein
MRPLSAATTRRFRPGAWERAEAGGEVDRRVGVVARTVFDAPPVEDDARGVDGLLLVALQDRHRPFQHVEDVRAVAVLVGVERRARPEREQFDEDVVGHDHFRGLDCAILRREVVEVESIEVHGLPSSRTLKSARGRKASPDGSLDGLRLANRV